MASKPMSAPNCFQGTWPTNIIIRTTMKVRAAVDKFSESFAMIFPVIYGGIFNYRIPHDIVVKPILANIPIFWILVLFA